MFMGFTDTRIFYFKEFPFPFVDFNTHPDMNPSNFNSANFPLLYRPSTINNDYLASYIVRFV